MTDPATPAAEWFHVDDARPQQGPHSADELVARYARGELRADTLVWMAVRAYWVPLAY